MPGVAAAIAAGKLLVKSVDPIDAANFIRVLQVGQDLVSFGVNIGADVMRDLTRRVAESHLAVKSRSTDPQGVTIRV